MEVALQSMQDMHDWNSKYIGKKFHNNSIHKLLIDAAFVQAKSDGVRILEIGEDVWGLGEYHNNDIDELIHSFHDANQRIAPEIELRLQIGLSRHCSFGYTGSGVAMWTTYSEFIYDMFNDCTSNLRDHDLFGAATLEKVRQELHRRLIVCDQFPSVLCHGDLSTKNILVHSDEIVLIDWDDTQSLCWMADIARLTFWMKLNYDDETAGKYRKVFLDRYETEYDKSIFYEIEDTLHVWYGLDYLNFSVVNTQYQYQYENVKAILQNSLIKCNMEMLT